jgi:hypothetical protein
MHYTTFKVKILPFYVLQGSQASGAGGWQFKKLCGLNVLYSSPAFN